MTNGELISIGGLAVAVIGLVIHALKQAVDYGALRQRVIHLEQAAIDNKDIAKLVIQMAEKVDQFGKRLDEVASGLTWLTKVPPETPGLTGPPGRRRSPAK
jgi:hypothetical protein